MQGARKQQGAKGRVSVHLAKRYILCFVDVVGSFFKLFCCLLQNYTKTMHVDEDGNVDDDDDVDADFDVEK